jgi:hypothetical protein
LGAISPSIVDVKSMNALAKLVKLHVRNSSDLLHRKVGIVFWPGKQFTLLWNSMIFGTISLADKVNQKVKSPKLV